MGRPLICCCCFRVSLQAVANAAYGNPDAFLIVVFDINGGNDLYNLFSTVFEDSLDQESVGDVLDAMAGRNRRLLQEQVCHARYHPPGASRQRVVPAVFLYTVRSQISVHFGRLGQISS